MQSCVQSSMMIFVRLIYYNHLCFNAVTRTKKHQIIYVNVAVKKERNKKWPSKDCLLHFQKFMKFCRRLPNSLFLEAATRRHVNYDLKFAANFGFVIVLSFYFWFGVLELYKNSWHLYVKNHHLQNSILWNKWEIIRIFGTGTFKVLFFSIVKNSLLCIIDGSYYYHISWSSLPILSTR